MQKKIMLIFLIVPAEPLVCKIVQQDQRGWRLKAAALEQDLSPLPRGISVYSKARESDVQSSIRRLALKAINQARLDGERLIELEFPPLLGGSQAKRATDDFTNIDVLDANRNWAMELSPSLASLKKGLWIVLPDAKELELTRENFPGGAYSQFTLTTLNEAATAVAGGDRDVADGLFSAGWLRKELRKVQPGTGDRESNKAVPLPDPALILVVQPGDGGPLEDYLNVELLESSAVPVLVLNGQLDRVREGYYNKFIFPKVASCAERFYSRFVPVFYLKPLVDKGFSGWLYRVYPEPWQVVLQQKEDGEEGVVVGSFDSRPTYRQSIELLKRAGMNRGR